MKLIPIITFLTLLIMPCIAVPDSVTTGPYKVTFDLGLPEDTYTILVSDPKESETLDGSKNMDYRITIENKTKDTSMANIGLIYYIDRENDVPNADQMGPIIEDLARAMKFRSAKTAVRDIDGTIGGIAQADFVGSAKIYLIEFLPLIDQKHLRCDILSTLPWDEGTLSLLKTIHIEKINSTS
ncbi:MAG: hypothetical protein WAW52_12585 [Methanothrix sp.]